MFRGSVKVTGYPFHSQVSSSLPLRCVTVCHHISTGLLTLGLPTTSIQVLNPTNGLLLNLKQKDGEALSSKSRDDVRSNRHVYTFSLISTNRNINLWNYQTSILVKTQNHFSQYIHILKETGSTVRIQVSLTFRLLMSYIYGAPILDVSRSHTTTQHSR